MGRWSTYRRRGGGPPSGAQPIEIISAAVTGTFSTEITYSQPINAGDFTAADFLTSPDNFVGDLIVPLGANNFELDFLADLGPETQLTYSGSVPNILTPQTVNLT